MSADKGQAPAGAPPAESPAQPGALERVALPALRWTQSGAVAGGTLGAVLGLVLAAVSVVVRGAFADAVIVAVFGFILLPASGILYGSVFGAVLGGVAGVVVGVVRASRLPAPAREQPSPSKSAAEDFPRPTTREFNPADGEHPLCGTSNPSQQLPSRCR
jgi:hypothetical protein